MEGNFGGDYSLVFDCFCFSTGRMTLAKHRRTTEAAAAVLHLLRAAGVAPHHWEFSKASGTGGYRSEGRVCKKVIPSTSTSIAANNNAVSVVHGFFNFCQEVVVITYWPVKKAKHWFRATLDTLCFSKHKQAQLIAVVP